MEAVNSKMGNCALHALAKGIQWQYSLSLLDHLVEEEVEVETWRFLFRSCGICGGGVVWKGCMVGEGMLASDTHWQFRIDGFSMSQLLLHLLGLCDELRVDVWSMTRAIRNLSTIMLGVHTMHIRSILMTFSANNGNGPMEYKNIIYTPWKSYSYHVPFKNPGVFPRLEPWPNLGQFLDACRGCDHVGNDCASMYSHRAMESAATETAWAGAAESQESATTCMACQSWGNMRQWYAMFFFSGVVGVRMGIS